ncbi:unnamed protein product [Blepharisma stoltei]|uniref:DNA/RNA-binding protein Alba-like domain-containing protein n=1 Tax=Blepharisma stoltei TaxID=1481888 RepID=A0AAU9IQI7_9CILI|nr:unnamed protein product [Blepharisma stoltei]
MATPKDEVSISSTQGLSKHITEVATLLEETGKAKITAINSAIPQALNLVELIKHRVKGIHQINTFERVEGTNKTRVTFLLSLSPLDSKDKGYQGPIPDSEVQEKSLSELKQAPPKPEWRTDEEGATRPRGSRGGRRGNRRGGRQSRGGSTGRTEGRYESRYEGRQEGRTESRPYQNKREPRTRDAEETKEGHSSERPRGRSQGRRPRGNVSSSGNRPTGQKGDYKPRDRRRAPEMEKYTRAPRKPEESTRAANEIFVNARAHPNLFIREALLLLRKDNLRTIVIKASGLALPRAVKVVEEIKRYEAGLHQVNKISKRNVKDVFTPNEPGLDEVVKERTIDGFEITLTKDVPDTKSPGYQAPLPASEVRAISLEEIEKL